MYNHQKSSDRAPRRHREGLPRCVLLPNFRSRIPGSFGASVTDPSGWSVLPRNRHEQLCSEQESSGLSFLQFSVSFEIRISSFLLLVNFTVRKLPERARFPNGNIIGHCHPGEATCRRFVARSIVSLYPEAPYLFRHENNNYISTRVLRFRCLRARAGCHEGGRDFGAKIREPGYWHGHVHKDW